MAFSKTTSVAALVLIVLSLVLLQHHVAEADEFDFLELATGVGSPAPQPPIDCGAACGERCKETKRPNLCKRACGSCCAKCGCVPPGTSGNHNVCPCYANLTTRNQVHKCP
ncbi:Gibberellin-regulated protein 9 [Linum perenne]